MARTGTVTWGTTTTLWCGQKVSEHVVVVKRVKGRFGCGLNILFNLFHKTVFNVSINMSLSICPENSKEAWITSTAKLL